MSFSWPVEPIGSEMTGPTLGPRVIGLSISSNFCEEWEV